MFNDRIAEIWINSTKSLTGHCIYSAGAVEAIATIIQMNGGFVHPNLNLDQPIDDGFKFCGKEAMSADIKFGLSNSFGFGGINTALVFRKIAGVET